MQRVAQQHQTGGRETVGDRHRADAPPHGAPAQHETLRCDGLLGAHRRGLLCDERHQPFGPRRRTPAATAAVGIVHSPHRQRGQRLLEGHEGVVVTVTTGAGRQQHPGDALRGTHDSRMRPRLHEGADPLAGVATCPAAVGMRGGHEPAEASLDVAGDKTVERLQLQHPQRPGARLRHLRRRRPVAVQEAQQLGVAASRPGHDPVNRCHHLATSRPGDLQGGVQRTQHVLRGRAAAVAELEGRAPVGFAHETVPAAGQADAVLLQAVTQPRLADPLAPVDLTDEQRQVVKQSSSNPAW